MFEISQAGITCGKRRVWRNNRSRENQKGSYNTVCEIIYASTVRETPVIAVTGTNGGHFYVTEPQAAGFEFSVQLILSLSNGFDTDSRCVQLARILSHKSRTFRSDSAKAIVVRSEGSMVNSTSEFVVRLRRARILMENFYF